VSEIAVHPYRRIHCCWIGTTTALPSSTTSPLCCRLSSELRLVVYSPLKLNDFLGLFRNSTEVGAHFFLFRAACTRSNSAMAWFSCRLIMASYRSWFSSPSVVKRR
jgi:hypothetical protein